MSRPLTIIAKLILVSLMALGMCLVILRSYSITFLSECHQVLEWKFETLSEMRLFNTSYLCIVVCASYVTNLIYRHSTSPATTYLIVYSAWLSNRSRRTKKAGLAWWVRRVSFFRRRKKWQYRKRIKKFQIKPQPRNINPSENYGK